MASLDGMKIDSELLTIVLRSIRRLQDNIDVAVESPDSCLDGLQETLKSDLGRLLASDGQQWFKRELLQLLECVGSFDEMRVEKALFDQRAHIAEDEPHVDSFLAVLDEAHDRFPFSPLMLVANPMTWGRSNMRAFSAIQLAQAVTGERRAQLMMSAVRIVVELTYKPYVQRLGIACHLADGQIWRPPQHLGNAIAQLARMIPNDSIVSVRATMYRNAAAHEQTRYMQEQDSIWYWAKPNHKESVELCSVDQLLDETCHYLYVAQAFQRAVNIRAEELWMPMLLPVLGRLPALLRGQLSSDEEALMDAEGARCTASLIDQIPRELMDVTQHLDDDLLGSPYEDKVEPNWCAP